MKFFVTGAAGFIGFHVARRLLLDGHEVVGYDGITDYYDPSLKRARLALLDKLGAFTAIEAMLEHKGRLEDAIAGSAPHAILHLAAQAGVRYSLENPGSYISANLVGTFNLLEAARLYRPAHLLIASTSSVYGGNLKTPFAEADRTDFPISLYAATKKSVEAISHSYAHLFGIPTTVMRFFTVYGPWGRPDMALYRFVSAIEDGKPIVVREIEGIDRRAGNIGRAEELDLAHDGSISLRRLGIAGDLSGEPCIALIDQHLAARLVVGRSKPEIGETNSSADYGHSQYRFPLPPYDSGNAIEINEVVLTDFGVERVGRRQFCIRVTTKHPEP